MSPVVHIAGLDVQIGSQLRQRCAWCGEVLVEYELSRIAVTDRGRGPATRPGTWEPGRLIEVTEGNPRQSVLLDPAEKMPTNACIDAKESRVL